MKVLKTIQKINYNSLIPDLKKELIFAVKEVSINPFLNSIKVTLEVYTFKKEELVKPLFNIETGEAILDEEGKQEIEKKENYKLKKISFLNASLEPYYFGGTFSEEDVTNMITLLISSEEISEEDSELLKISKAILSGVKYKLAEDTNINLTLEDLEEIEI